MTQDFKNNVQTTKRVLNIDLKEKYYRKITAQKLKEDKKTCCQWIKKNINHNKLMFTDEKILTKNGYFNPKNDIVWDDDRSDATERDGLYSKEKYPVSIMIALVTTCYGLTSPDFFQQGQYLNGQTYHDKLLPFYQKESLNTKITGNHTNRKAQQWCKKNFIPKDRWASELNPLDYSIWDNISKHVKCGHVKKFDD